MSTGADWVDSARRLVDALRPPAEVPSTEPGDDRVAHGSDCRWCPVCQAAAVLRGERPELTAALADVLATTASVLRDLTGDPGRPAAAPDQQGSPADPGTPDGEPGPGTVQRIDIA